MFGAGDVSEGLSLLVWLTLIALFSLVCERGLWGFS